MSKPAIEQMPESVVGAMVSASAYYNEPRIYKFGFYDGYKIAKEEYCKLLEEKDKEIAELNGRIQQGHKVLSVSGGTNDKEI